MAGERAPTPNPSQPWCRKLGAPGEGEEGEWETGKLLSGSEDLPSLDGDDLNMLLRQEEGASPPVLCRQEQFVAII